MAYLERSHQHAPAHEPHPWYYAMKHQCPPAHAAADNPVCATPVVSFGLSENLEYVLHMERQHVKSGIGGVGWAI